MKKKKFDYLTLTFGLVTSLLFNSFPLSVRAYTGPINIEKNIELDNDDVVKSLIDSESESERNKTEYAEIICYQLESELAKRDQVFEDYIREYCDYFNLRYDETIELAKEYTNNYTTESSISINGHIIDINNPEQFAMFICYSIYNNSDEYGVQRESVVSENSITNIDNTASELVLSNGYTFNDFVYKVSGLVGIDSNLVLAISDYECGYQTSSQAENKNNFGGLKNGSGYMTFPTPEAGIIALVFTVDKIYYEYDIKDMYDLSGVYVNGNINRPSSHWVNSVDYIQNDISNNEDEVYTLSYR